MKQKLISFIILLRKCSIYLFSSHVILHSLDLIYIVILFNYFNRGFLLSPLIILCAYFMFLRLLLSFGLGYLETSKANILKLKSSECNNPSKSIFFVSLVFLTIIAIFSSINSIAILDYEFIKIIWSFLVLFSILPKQFLALYSIILEEGYLFAYKEALNVRREFGALF